MELLLLDRLSTLSHPHRMELFRLLMRRCPDAVPAGEIATALGLKASTTSTYLAALTQSGLITQERDGTKLLYAVDLDAVRDVVGGLFYDCCRGRADLCPPEMAALIPAPDNGKKLNVLFVCTGNSARSIMAETLLRENSGDRFNAYSAGTAYRSELNPLAVAVLVSRGHDVAPLRSKHLSQFQGPNAVPMDFVFTVCDRAANEDCPTWGGHTVTGHWGIPDPVAAAGSHAQQQAAFERAYAAIQGRITAFTALPFDELDMPTLQRKIDDIGRMQTDQEKLS